MNHRTMEDYDDQAYFESLAAPAPAPTTRLTGPVRRAHAFATTPPGTRRNTSSNYSNSRERYWRNEQPVLQNLDWSSIKTKVPATKRLNIKSICLTQYANKLRQTKGEWTEKTEALANEFNSIIPNLEAQAENVISDINSKDSLVYNYQNGQLLDANYAPINVPAANNFTAQERMNIHWYKFAMDVDPFDINVGTSGINTAFTGQNPVIYEPGIVLGHKNSDKRVRYALLLDPTVDTLHATLPHVATCLIEYRRKDYHPQIGEEVRFVGGFGEANTYRGQMFGRVMQQQVVRKNGVDENRYYIHWRDGRSSLHAMDEIRTIEKVVYVCMRGAWD